MGGKARRRREKNYLRAHGGLEPLAPPPSSKEIDAIPSKLRRLIELKNFAGPKGAKASQSFGNANKSSKGSKNEGSSALIQTSMKEPVKCSDHEMAKDESVAEEVEKIPSKRKRKRGIGKLLHLMEEESLRVTNRKKERRKKFFEAKKKKQKNKNSEDLIDFPKQETIKFGEVVSAPPKLQFPKTSLKEAKMRQDVSQERLRLQAIEDYRNRRKWTSRPGSHVPPSNVSEISNLLE